MMEAASKTSPSAILQSGPRPPRRLKIRLIARILNTLSLGPRNPTLSHTKFSLTRNAASIRDRRSILPHKVDGLRRKDVGLSNIARSRGIRRSARCLTLIDQVRGDAPRRMQQRVHSNAPSNKRSIRTFQPQAGQTNWLHEPQF
jgi:hypothetical protein